MSCWLKVIPSIIDLWHVCCLQEWDGGERRWRGATWRLHWGESPLTSKLLSLWFGFGEAWFGSDFYIKVSDSPLHFIRLKEQNFWWQVSLLIAGPPDIFLQLVVYCCLLAEIATVDWNLWVFNRQHCRPPIHNQKQEPKELWLWDELACRDTPRLLFLLYFSSLSNQQGHHHT